MRRAMKEHLPKGGCAEGSGERGNEPSKWRPLAARSSFSEKESEIIKKNSNPKANAGVEKILRRFGGKLKESLREKDNNGRGSQKRTNLKRKEGKGGTKRGGKLNLCTLNVVDGKQGRLALACNRLRRHNVDIVILTETKTVGFCPSKAFGYTIVATKAKSMSQGGVALAFREAPNRNWHIEDAKAVDANIVCATLVHGDNSKINLVGVYIPPSEVDMRTTKVLEAHMGKVDEEKTILMGDMNVSLREPKDARQEAIVDELRAMDLRDVATRFKPRRKAVHWWTW